jgi:hypothetical protein
MKQVKVTQRLQINTIMYGSGTVLAILAFSCGQPTQKKSQDSAPVLKEECVDKSATGSSKVSASTTSKSTKDKKTTAAAKLFLQGTGTATGTGTGTSTAKKITYNDDIKPLMQTNCGLGNCHSAAPRILLGTYQVAKAAGTTIVTRVNGTGALAMPPETTPALALTAPQKALITQWQTDGFLELAPVAAPPPATQTSTGTSVGTSKTTNTSTGASTTPPSPPVAETEDEEESAPKSEGTTGSKVTKSSKPKANAKAPECE